MRTIRKSKIIDLLLFIFIFAAFWTTFASAANIPGSLEQTLAELGRTLPGTTLTVTNVAELVEAVNQANAAGGNRTIVLADGTYTLSEMLWISGDQITFRSQSGHRDAVILRGQGMTGSATHIFNVAGKYFTAADLTLGWVRQHAIQIHGESNADFPVIHNVRCVDTGEQMLKVSFRNGDRTGADDGVIEGSIFEYSAGIGPQSYIGGIDAHQAARWIVRQNVFRSIRSPESSSAEHAIHFWSGSSDTLVENNRIINCDRGIGFGLGTSGHSGGVIRNNMVSVTRDVGIGLENSSQTAVYNNTVFTANYMNSIEYRFAKTTGGAIINNLTNATIASRDGGTATVQNNVATAQASWFVNPNGGDLHLTTARAEVVDQGQTLADVTADIDNEARPQGQAYDIGADEFRGLAPTPVQINGDWSAWSWTPCTKGCDGGTRQKVRTCNNPEPQNGGSECTRRDGGQTTATNRVETAETVPCNQQACTGPKDLIPPSIPQNMQASVVSDTKIQLQWDASIDNTGVVKYRIYNQNNIVIGVTEKTSYTPGDYTLNNTIISLLTPATTYQFTVTALDACGNESEHSQLVQATTRPFQKGATVLNPYTDLKYLGAFRLPEGSGGSTWGYGGQGLTYYPGGDPAGPNDGYPGSLFGFGHIYQRYVSEISIPKPIISPHKNFNDLNIATTLQPFAKVDNFDHPNLLEALGNIAYLPKQASQQSDKLYYIFASNYQWSKLPSHSASDLTLANPNSQGWWYIGKANGQPPYYSTIFYLFEIPKEWADAHTGGRRLLTGGTRSGSYNGFGTAFFAIGPWLDKDPLPAYQAELSYTTLLEYGQVEGVNTQEGRVVTDGFGGGAWLTSGKKSAIVLTGNKGYGEVTYNGGYKSTLARPVLMFFDPADLEAVANGTKKAYEPQPYALLDVGQYLFRDEPRLLSAAYDRQHELLYVFESNDGNPIIHVFQIVLPAQYPLAINKSGTGADLGTVTGTPAGIACGNTCSAAINEGTVVLLTATTQPGSVFKGWTGAGCSGTSTCQVTMDSAKSVTATFAIDEGDVQMSKTQTPLHGEGVMKPFVVRGEAFAYTITAKNLYEEAITLVISDTLSAFVDYVKDSLKVNGQTVANASFSPQGLQYESALLNHDETLTMTFAVKVKDDALLNGMITNAAAMTAYFFGATDPVIANRTSNVVQVQIKSQGDTPVPEPSTIGLFGGGLLGLSLLLRKHLTREK